MPDKKTLLGAIAGDIIGSRFEFNNIKTKEFELINYQNDYTDDSVMTIAIAKALLECEGEYSGLDKMVVKWMRLLGNEYPDAGYGGNFLNWLFVDNPMPYNSWGNGSAMRVSACGYVANSIEEAENLAKITAEVTHNHPEGIKGAQATAAAVYMARNGEPIEKIKDFIVSKYYEIDFTLDDIRDDYDFDISCQGTVPQAMEAFFESTGYEDAIRNAVSIGGDSDTLGAITGAVAGAYYGVPEDITNCAEFLLNGDLKEIVEEFDRKFIR